MVDKANQHLTMLVIDAMLIAAMNDCKMIAPVGCVSFGAWVPGIFTWDVCGYTLVLLKLKLV